MADVRPIYRDSTTGQLKEFTDSDTLVTGATFLDYATLYKTAFFDAGDSGFTPRST